MSLTVGTACGGGDEPQPESIEPDRPNVLFIAVDDLNDWIEPLGGHPQALTPNLARLAERSVLFERAYTPSPSCNPARTALLTGLHTFTTGMYSNEQIWRDVLPEAVTLPRYFSNHGYWSAGAGKIFHNNQPDPRSWDAYWPSLEWHMPDYRHPLDMPGTQVNMVPFEGMYVDFDWAPLDVPDEKTGDQASVDWVIEQLQRRHEGPFFLAAGIYRPHLPWYVPQQYFDLFPLEAVELPAVSEDDVSDLPARALELARRGGNYHQHVIEADLWREAVRGYLASIAYADAQVGRLLDALDASGYADDTIVVLWSDHGWQLGEKQHWRKWALWENLARVVLMIRTPEGAPGLPSGSADGRRSPRVVSLIDLYPTLVELAGLPEKPGLDGRSLVPLLEDPHREWPHPALTTHEVTEFSVRDERWRYIRYIDGGEELYDHSVDPEEWTNLALDPDHADVRATMAAHIPEDPAPFVDTSYPFLPYYLPPPRSREEYLERRARGLVE